ncbi:tRNA-splicing endonuclease subunit sen54 N-term-domain-containing protein [Aspergillus recurvatus]
MVDLDEDAITNPSTGGAHADIDLSDETQDFRMLNNLSFVTDPTELSLPKRGEKDFEPNPTLFQADILSASRQAMHNALAYPRLHNPRNWLIGVYVPNGPAPPAASKTLDTIAEDTPLEKAAPVSVGAHVSPDSCVYITNPKGQHFKSLGQADRWGRVWLLPEEALYLLERGSVDIRWPCCAVGAGDEDNIEDSGIPMSLQAAYACLMGRGGLTMERFSVFTGLRRLGYAVIRAPGWSESEQEESTQSVAQSGVQQGPGLMGIFSRFLQWLRDTAPTTALGPVAGLGFHHSYDSIFRKLSLIPCYDPITSASSYSRPELPYIVVWHVYKPSTSFRKSAPPSPDFKIAVINARTSTTIPTLSQIGNLLESTPLDPPRPDKQLYVRLKNGHRNVILAVVDQGVVSYLRISDAAFGKEKIYAQRPSGGNKFRGPPRHKFKKR